MHRFPWRYYLIALLVIALDQTLKLWVHYHMDLGPADAIRLLGNWVKLQYTLNPGMAFGIQMGFVYDKLLLTLGRLAAVVVIVHYLRTLYQQRSATAWLSWGWALVLGGAIGNLIDSLLYGVLLHNAPYNAPMKWCYGQVIDMIYVDLYEVVFPAWVPLLGNGYLSILPIFNLADVSIFLGVAAILWHQRLLLLMQAPSSAPISPSDSSSDGDSF